MILPIRQNQTTIKGLQGPTTVSSISTYLSTLPFTLKLHQLQSNTVSPQYPPYPRFPMPQCLGTCCSFCLEHLPGASHLFSLSRSSAWSLSFILQSSALCPPDTLSQDFPSLHCVPYHRKVHSIISHLGADDGHLVFLILSLSGYVS